MRWKNPILLTASLIFFAWSSPAALLLLPVHILVHYLLGFFLEKLETNRQVLLTAGVIFDLLPVLVQILFRPAIPVHLSAVAALCAIHGITYLTEVYRRETRAQMNFSALGVYLIMFPRAIAGPIVHYDDLRSALARRSTDFARAADGIWRFTAGLAKKVLLADRLFALWTETAALSSPGCVPAWLGLGAFCLAFWLGFSGCCDMAVGLGMMFGFDLPENFFRPLSASSLREFSRRWNATLYSWIRDHFWQPAFSRHPRLLPAAILLTSALTGFFYGCRPAALLWGLYMGLAVLGEHFLWGKAAEKLAPALRRGIVLITVLIGCVFLSSETIFDMLRTLAALIGLNGFGLGQGLYLAASYWLVLLTALLGALRWPERLFRGLLEHFPAVEKLRPAAILLLLTACTAYMI